MMRYTGFEPVILTGVNHHRYSKLPRQSHPVCKAAMILAGLSQMPLSVEISTALIG
jgi:hypothetical protein